MRHLSRYHRLLPAILAFGAAGAQAPTSRDVLVRTLDSLANAGVTEGRAVGLSVAVVKGNDTLLLKGYGKADAEWNIPTPADAVYEIGSVTKQFTAAAILQLRDEGKLSLDDELTRFLPDFPTRGHKYTLRRLLDHTSGLKGLTEIPEFRLLSATSHPRDSALELIKRTPPQFAPGEAMVYNNSAFWLLGLVIEKASGMTYEDYVEKRIFAPLGMTRSMYCNSSEVVDRRAHGYQYQGTVVRRAALNIHTWPYAAGSLCSTAGDMVTWLRALHGGKVLSPKSYAEMIMPSKLNDGTLIRYNMGLSIGHDVRGLKVIGHGGAITGFVSEASWYPDAQMAVVVVMNSAGPISPSAIASELAGAVLPWNRPTLPGPFVGDVAPLVGKYKGPARGPDMTIEVMSSGQGISISVNSAAARPLPWTDAWTFRLGATIVTFKRNGQSGPATELRFDTGGGHFVLKRQ